MIHRFIRTRGSLSDGIAPCTSTVSCDGAAHRLTWSAGELIVEDHDRDAERVLKGLGGQTPLCLELARAWKDSLREPRAYLGLADPSTVTSYRRTSIATARSFAWARHARPRATSISATATLQHVPGPIQPPPAPRADDHHVRMVVLARLPDPLRRRLVLSALDAPSNARAQDEENVLRMCTIRAFRKLSRGDPRIRPMTKRTTGAPEVTIEHGRAVVSLPPSWLRSVWLPVLTRVDGWFVLQASEGEATRSARLLKLDRRGRPVLAGATIDRTGGGWRVTRIEEAGA